LSPPRNFKIKYYRTDLNQRVCAQEFATRTHRCVEYNIILYELRSCARENVENMVDGIIPMCEISLSSFRVGPLKNDPPTGNAIDIRCKTALAIIRVVNHTRVLCGVCVCVCVFVRVAYLYDIYIYNIYYIIIIFILYTRAYGVRLTISFSYEARGGCPFQGLHSLRTPSTRSVKIK